MGRKKNRVQRALDESASALLPLRYESLARTSRHEGADLVGGVGSTHAGLSRGGVRSSLFATHGESFVAARFRLVLYPWSCYEEAQRKAGGGALWVLPPGGQDIETTSAEEQDAQGHKSKTIFPFLGLSRPVDAGTQLWSALHSHSTPAPWDQVVLVLVPPLVASPSWSSTVSVSREEVQKVSTRTDPTDDDYYILHEAQLRWETGSCWSCPICLESMVAPRMLRCGHVFCFSCILRVLHEQRGLPATCVWSNVEGSDGVKSDPLIKSYLTTSPPPSAAALTQQRLCPVCADPTDPASLRLCRRDEDIFGSPENKMKDQGGREGPFWCTFDLLCRPHEQCVALSSLSVERTLASTSCLSDSARGVPSQTIFRNKALFLPSVDDFDAPFSNHLLSTRSFCCRVHEDEVRELLEALQKFKEEMTASPSAADEADLWALETALFCSLEYGLDPLPMSLKTARDGAPKGERFVTRLSQTLHKKNKSQPKWMGQQKSKRDAMQKEDVWCPLRRLDDFKANNLKKAHVTASMFTRTEESCTPYFYAAADEPNFFMHPVNLAVLKTASQLQHAKRVGVGAQNMSARLSEECYLDSDEPLLVESLPQLPASLCLPVLFTESFTQTPSTQQRFPCCAHVPFGVPLEMYFVDLSLPFLSDLFDADVAQRALVKHEKEIHRTKIQFEKREQQKQEKEMLCPKKDPVTTKASSHCSDVKTRNLTFAKEWPDQSSIHVETRRAATHSPASFATHEHIFCDSDGWQIYTSPEAFESAAYPQLGDLSPPATPCLLPEVHAVGMTPSNTSCPTPMQPSTHGEGSAPTLCDLLKHHTEAQWQPFAVSKGSPDQAFPSLDDVAAVHAERVQEQLEAAARRDELESLDCGRKRRRKRPKKWTLVTSHRGRGAGGRESSGSLDLGHGTPGALKDPPTDRWSSSGLTTRTDPAQAHIGTDTESSHKHGDVTKLPLHSLTNEISSMQLESPRQQLSQRQTKRREAFVATDRARASSHALDED